MRFLVNKSDFEINKSDSDLSKDYQPKVTAATSVNILKNDFFNELSKIGELVQIDDLIEKERLVKLCSEKNVIYICFNSEPLYDVNCRLLTHSLGSLLLTGGFLNKWFVGSSTFCIVTSHTQRHQLKKSLGKSCFNLGVFTPNIQRDLFDYSSSRFTNKNNKPFRLVYSGRLIANKGIIQTIRALNFWPLKHAKLTLIGDFEPDFLIYQSNSYNTTFPNYFFREGIDRSPNLCVIMKSSIDRKELKNEYRLSDCFIYPSFHEDENFGLAPREAILSGIPTVVSDFCGLGNLKNTSGFAIKTYPSLGGVRYSLKELADSIHILSNRNTKEAKLFAYTDAQYIDKECNRKNAKNDLIEVIKKLKKLPLSPSSEGGWRSRERINRWVKSENPLFKTAVDLRDDTLIDGLYVDGTGPIPEGKWFSNAHFMQAIQSIYTTLPSPPSVDKNAIYRGFWRIKLWEQENALVEFGFPGPRTIRFSDKEFKSLKGCYNTIGKDDGLFIPKKEKEIILIQKLIELGYLVPDEF